MLNLLTLHISNDEVAGNYEQYQVEKVERGIPLLTFIVICLFIQSCYYAFIVKTGPRLPIVIQVGYFLIAEFGYRLTKLKFKKTRGLTQIFIVLAFAVPTVTCTLANLNLLPDALLGPGVNVARDYFRATFFLLYPFHIIRLKYVLICITPLYFIASYFYYAWLRHN